MKKILLLSQWYPLTISRYFERALRRNRNIELYTIGPYTGSWIPWMGGMNLPAKYAIPPNIQLPPNGARSFPFSLAKSKINFQPDLILTVDAGIYWDFKPDMGCPVVHVATDPHVLDYSVPRSYSDFFFNMQKCYSKDGDIYLPYAFDPSTHFPIPDIEKKIDACLIGMPYSNRASLVNELRNQSISVLFENGPIFDEYREMANLAFIGLNWSSLNDLVARVFEIMAMELVPVINRVPDLGEFFQEDIHYLGFSNMQEAIDKVKWAKANPKDAERIAANAHNLVWHSDHTYDARVQQVLEMSGVL